MPTEMIDEKNSDGSPNPIENESTADRVRLEQIVTGGQAGVDRAALDAARDAAFLQADGVRRVGSPSMDESPTSTRFRRRPAPIMPSGPRGMFGIATAHWF